MTTMNHKRVATGYVHCSHRSCFAIIIGRPGDVCDDCRACDENPHAIDCDGCDNDARSEDRAEFHFENR